MQARGVRRSDRISLVVPIQVSGVNADGLTFKEHSRTVKISRHGAEIVLGHRLLSGQALTIRHMGTGMETQFRVVGLIGGEGDSSVYGVALRDETEDLWGVTFPSPPEAENAVARVFLECRGCQARAVAYLNEIETEVFQADRYILRSCERCRKATLWQAAVREESSEPVSEIAPEAAGSGGLSDSKVRTRDQPKDVGARVKMIICVRHPGFGDEVAVCETLSRGGFCFKSRKRHFTGSRIEVAIPYTRRGGNIFVLARVVDSEQVPEEDRFIHTAEYVRNYDRGLGS